MMARQLNRALSDALRQVSGMSPEELTEQRLARLMSYGRFTEVNS